MNREAKRKNPKLCPIAWCRNKKGVRRRGSYESHEKYCWRCKSRRLKQFHPWTYLLKIIRQRAKRKGISFSLTVAEFKNFYIRHLTQRKELSLCVDRIDRHKGYHIWNIRPLSFEENSNQGRDNTPRGEIQ